MPILCNMVMYWSFATYVLHSLMYSNVTFILVSYVYLYDMIWLYTVIIRYIPIITKLVHCKLLVRV
jgi:hypothetical protein